MLTRAISPDLPVRISRCLPAQLALVDQLGDIRATALEHAIIHSVRPSRKDTIYAGHGFTLARLERVIVRNQLNGIELRLIVEEFFKQVLATVIPVERVGAQADAHTKLATFLGNAGVKLPPLIGENIGMLGVRWPTRRIRV